jgi:PAS domain S-box-containing protein
MDLTPISDNCTTDNVVRSQTVESTLWVKWGIGSIRQFILPGVLVLLGYYLGAKIGFAFTFQPHPVSVMWPPNSILMAALLLNPVRSWWFLLACALPAHLAAELQSGVPVTMVLCWFLSNCGEALVGAVSTRFLLGPSPRFDRMKSIGLLLACGAVVAPFLVSFLDSAFVMLNHFGHQTYWQVWSQRYCSNVFTGMVLLPVMVAWCHREPTPIALSSSWRLSEVISVFTGLLVVSVFVFSWQQNGPDTNPALLYLPLPFILWAAVRFGPKGSSSAILLVALLAIWGAVHGQGPFTSRSPDQNARAIQLFFIVISMAFGFLTASIIERGRAEQRFTRVFLSSPDAMVVSRLDDGYIIEVNECWERSFGFRREETIGRTSRDLNFYPSDADREKLVACMYGRVPVHDFELCLRTKAGDLRHVQISADTDEIGGQQCRITIMRDITDRRRAEEAQESLAHLSKLAMMGEMTAMVAHEVNQPLGAILSNAETAEILLDSEQPKLAEVRQILADIRHDDLRAAAAIRRVRALLAKRNFQMQPLDLDDTVSDVLKIIAGDALRRRVHIQKVVQANLPLVLGDRSQLQQVLLNLILNAMDAMHDTPEPRRRISVKVAENRQGEVQVTVEDCGPGVSQEQAAHIFESFFTTKNDGMGLGLSIARSIIEAHRGNLWLDSNSRDGATFHFTVRPAANHPAGQSAERRS